MSNFLNSALKNLGLKSDPHGRQERSSSRSSLREFDLRLRVDDTDESSFLQWKDAMKMVARLPDGIPPDFRKQLWLALAKRYMERKNINFDKVIANCLNDKDDPDESELGTQIVKDLHRTGYSVFSGEVAEQNQRHLKHVLLAYAKWNIHVGYCQGFNMLAAIILEVVNWVEEDALKVMIFLIEGVLPESYFANHLRGLSVDMAVFRDLLRMRLLSLSQHLDKLQASSQDSSTGYSYEPPLTNVFTMQWFLTLFSNCLPKPTVLRVWDLIFLEGNEVLLRTALAIWDGLADRIMSVDSADEFYSIMGVLTREILEFGLMDANALLKTVCTLAPFPFPKLHELRDSYTYNIQPFSSSWSSSRQFHIFNGDADDEETEEDLVAATWGVGTDLQFSKKKAIGSAVFSSIGPGAFSSGEGTHLPLSLSNFNTERMTLDISALKQQYSKLKERQKQAHVILTGAFQNQFYNRPHNSLAVNHLLLGKQPLTRRKSAQSHLKFAEKGQRSVVRTPSASGRESSCSLPSLGAAFALEDRETRKTRKSSSPQSSFSTNKDSDSDSSTGEPIFQEDSGFDESLYKFSKNSSTKPREKSKVELDKVLDGIPHEFSTVLVPLDSEPEVPTPANPFPTKRRVGSTKKLSR